MRKEVLRIKKTLSVILVFSILLGDMSITSYAENDPPGSDELSQTLTRTVTGPDAASSEPDIEEAASVSDSDSLDLFDATEKDPLSLTTASDALSVSSFERREIEGSSTIPREMNSYISTRPLSSPVYSYIYDNGDGTFTILDYNTDKVCVDIYRKKDCVRIKSQTVKKELSLFGGFYSGVNYNYIVFGQKNENESNTAEVIRVVKYDKGFNRRGALSLSNCYTTVPFDAGSLRMAEYGNELLIHTSRLRYKTADGKNHQSQLTIAVNTDNMSLKNTPGEFEFQVNHVSHSFNQFVQYDGASPVLLDHGDAYPRSIVLHKLDPGAASVNQKISLFDIKGAIGANCTGVTLGGFEISQNNYIVAANTIDHTKAKSFNSYTIDIEKDERDVAIFTYPRDGKSSVKKILLTGYVGKNKLASTPYLVKLSDTEFAVLWEEYEYTTGAMRDNGVKIVKIDEDGEMISAVNTYESFHLSSDCQPAAMNQVITWYINDASGKRSLYLINAAKFKQVQNITVGKLGTKYMGDKPFKLKVTPDKKAGLADFVFSSTNPNVATIDADGLITIRGIGSTKIKVTQAGNSKYLPFSHTQKLTVKRVPVKEVQITCNNEEIHNREINIGESFTLAALAVPETATYHDIVWSSSSAAIAFVTQSGLVTGLTPGRAIIRAEVANDGAWSSCSVTVKDPKVSVTKVTLTPASSILAPGETLELNASVYPENATDQSITWSSSNDSIATVSGNGIVTANTIGAATVTVTTKDGSKTASCQIVVREAGDFWVEPIDDQPYTGKAIKPKLTIWDGDYKLVPDKDYKVTYKNNKNVPIDYTEMPSAIVTGIGNYSGTQTIPFYIVAKDLNDADIMVNNITTEYTGKVQKKKPTISWNGKKLTAGIDYKITYTQEATEVNGVSISFRNVGWHEIILTGKGNYTGTRKIYEIIAEKKFSIANATAAKIGKIAYRGDYITLTEHQLKLTMGTGSKKVKLVEGKDYTVTYLNNKEIGKATALVTGIGKYAGTKKVYFNITGKSIKKADITGLKDVTYTGEEQAPNINVSLNGTLLQKDKDYTVTLSAHKNAGKVTVTIRGINAYTDSVKKTFRIKPYDLKTDKKGKISVVQQDITMKYTSKGCQPKPVLTFGGTPLTAGKDYTISYKNNNAVSAGKDKKPTIIIKGKGNFKGTLKREFTIIAKALNDAEAPVRLAAPGVVYQNKQGNYICKPILIDVNGKELTAGKDYRTVYSLQDGTPLTGKDTVPANTTIKIRVIGKGAYHGELEASYQVAQKSIAKATIIIPAQTYTGNDIFVDEKDVVIMVDGAPLVPGTDYRLVKESYKNNLKAGTAKVTIIGQGNYGGKREAEFQIKAKLLRCFHL